MVLNSKRTFNKEKTMEQRLPKWERLVTFLLGTFCVTWALLALSDQINISYDRGEVVVNGNYITDPQQPTKTEIAKLRQELDCLARNIYWEARSESTQGKIAVAQVTMNRVEHEKFPNSVCEVVYQGPTYQSWKNEQHPIRNRCQFSWYCDGLSDNIPPVNISIFKECYDIAKKVLLQEVRLPKLQRAVYYHADYVNPGWKNKKVAKIGRHIFYSDS